LVGNAWDGVHIVNALEDGIQVESAGYGLYAVGMDNYGVEASGATFGGYFGDTDSGVYAYIAYGGYGILSNGTKNFIQQDPTNPNKSIIYASLEGGEAGTYYRGTGQLTNGTARITLPEHFSLVTEQEGLTIQVTPRGDCKGLYVTEVTTTYIVVKELQGGTSDARFDFYINGVRAGYADYQPVVDNAQLDLNRVHPSGPSQTESSQTQPFPPEPTEQPQPTGSGLPH
jgi:hypothetical protein